MSSPSQKHTRPSRKLLRRAARSIMKSRPLPISRWTLPLRLRLWFMVFTCIIMIVLAFLGFTNPLSLNDKVEHFACFMVATGVFYFIFDVEEDARRIWFWRYFGLISTGIVCFFFGGIVSEIVQSILPYRQFDFGDVLANITGATIGLLVAYHLEKYYRHRREIARLYQPLNTFPDSDSETEETQLLPIPGLGSGIPRPGKPSASKASTIGLRDVWDEREELFEIGGSDEEDDVAGQPQAASEDVGPAGPTGPPPPKILVTTA